MKILFTVFLICTITLSAFTQLPQTTIKSTNTEKEQLYYSIHKGWNITTEQWENSYKVDYSYDANGYAITSFGNIWNSAAGLWETVEKIESTYDDNGNLTSYTGSRWEDDLNQWENSSKSEHAYDDNGNLIATISREWNSSTSQWENSNKTERTYDDNGNLALTIQSYWNIMSQWENIRKYEYNYGTNGYMTEFIYSDWNNELSEWAVSGKSEHYYDDNGYLVEQIGSNWNSSSDEWENSFKLEQAYDDNGNHIAANYSNWNSSSDEWENSFKFEYTYDFSFSISDLLLPPLNFISTAQSEHIVNQPVGYTNYSYVNNNWVNIEQVTYSYSPDNALYVSDFAVQEHVIYPNPASEYITVDFTTPSDVSKIEIFTLQGKTVLSHRLTKSTINVSSLSAGMYLYQLNLNGKISKGKLMIK